MNQNDNKNKKRVAVGAGIVAIIILILLLLVEFTLNVPVKQWYRRLLSAFAALFLIGFCMPTF